MGFIDVWGPVLDDAEQLFSEAREARDAGKRSHSGSFDFLKGMTDQQLRAACLGAAMAAKVAGDFIDEEAAARKSVLDE